MSIPHSHYQIRRWRNGIILAAENQIPGGIGGGGGPIGGIGTTPGEECPNISGTGLDDPSAWTPTHTGTTGNHTITSSGMSVTHISASTYDQVDLDLNPDLTGLSPGCQCLFIDLSFTMTMGSVTGGTGQVAIVADINGSELASSNITQDAPGTPGSSGDTVHWVFDVNDPLFEGGANLTLTAWVLSNTIGSAGFTSVNVSLGPCP